jgi:hypothetical protein
MAPADRGLRLGETEAQFNATRASPTRLAVSTEISRAGERPERLRRKCWFLRVLPLEINLAHNLDNVKFVTREALAPFGR